MQFPFFVGANFNIKLQMSVTAQRNAITDELNEFPFHAFVSVAFFVEIHQDAIYHREHHSLQQKKL